MGDSLPGKPGLIVTITVSANPGNSALANVDVFEKAWAKSDENVASESGEKAELPVT
jgi:hypothetical protein